MSEKPMTVTEMARMGGIARAKAHRKSELRAWGKQGGRPAVFDKRSVSRLIRMLAKDKSHAECAKALGLSVRTIGRVVARIKAVTEAKSS